MRALAAAAVLVLLALIGSAFSATAPSDNFSCPPNYQRTDSCSIGPCRCATFQVLKIQTQTTGTPRNTDIWFNVSNACPDPMYYVSFSIAGLNVSYAGQNFGAWTVSIVDGSSTTAPTNPPILWLRFSQKNPIATYSNITTGIGWEVFKFTVNPYSASTQWTVQAHMGAKYDTFSGIDFSQCPCDNCDGGSSVRLISPCTLGYPDTSPGVPARAGVVFNENECLHSYAIVGSSLQMFYNDEHAMTLGMRQLLNGSVTTPYSFSSFTGSTSYCVNSPSIGATAFDPRDVAAAVDDATCLDSTPCGRPLYPCLFITDITNDANNRSGDWQYSGTPIVPHKLCGVWKGVTKVIGGAGCPSGTVTNGVYCTEPDPASNRIGTANAWYLGPGSDPTAPCIAGRACTYQDFGAELSWNLDALNLQPSHRYRFQFIVHDGDQNKPGGDVGQGCIIASSACPAGYTGTACDVCDTNPLPGDGSYQWFCYPTGSGGASAYQLIKLPTFKLNQAPYNTSGGFVIAPNKTDAQGYAVDCMCQRTVVPCPNSCCGGGTCNDTNGVCTCADPLNQDATTCCPLITPPPGTPPPCLNGGQFCSGNGLCNTTAGACVCQAGWTGDACEVPIAPPTCVDFSQDCDTCIANSTATGIPCVWCNDGSNGGCFLDSVCVSPIYSCSVTVTYTPEPCPDNCTYPQGECKLVSDLPPDPEYAGLAPNATVCVCKKPFSGINCGNGPPHGLSAGQIAGISAGAITGIVLGALVVAALLGYGTKKGIDHFYFDQKAMGTARENPLHEAKTKEKTNAMYRGSNDA